MTDILKQLRSGIQATPLKIKAANEIESLRQGLLETRTRVKELEQLSAAISRDCNNTALERNALQAELAALKSGDTK